MIETVHLNAAHTVLPRVDFTSMHVVAIDEWRSAEHGFLAGHVVAEAHVAPWCWRHPEDETAPEWFNVLVDNLQFDNGF